MRQIITFNNKNVILPEPYVRTVPADDEIWYTSSDGNVVDPISSAFPTMVSNTYVDGKGVIKFATELTSIGASAFYGRSSLTSIIIPNSVTSIGNGAFLYCGGLTYISYNGTIAQWNAITKVGPVWHEGVPATVVHCTDGDAPI